MNQAMHRYVLIPAAALVLLSFLLAGRMGKRLARRRGRFIRIFAFLGVEAMLAAGCFLPCGYPGLSCGCLAAALSLLLQPVPPAREMRPDALSAAALAALPLAFFLPRPGAAVLGCILLLERILFSRRRVSRLESFSRIHTFRRHLVREDRANWEILWLSLLTLTALTDGLAAGAPVSAALSLLLYLWLDLRWCLGNPFFAVPALGNAVDRLPGNNRRPPPEKERTEPDRALYERCCRYMNERRPFLVESFSLQDLANAMFSNKVYLSRTINEISGKNFRQWLNHYRIHYAQELFRRNMSLKIVDLASLSGFRSVTSFNNAFKAVMDEPPSAWCRRVRYRSGLPQ